jgi:hypothetical protein
MILELVEFNTPAGWDRAQVLDDAKHVAPRWRAERDLVRKHFLLSTDGKTGAGVYIWPSIEAANKAHNAEWRAAVIKRTGAPPTRRYFDLLLLVDNENGAVTEYSADGKPVRLSA